MWLQKDLAYMTFSLRRITAMFESLPPYHCQDTILLLQCRSCGMEAWAWAACPLPMTPATWVGFRLAMKPQCAAERGLLICGRIVLSQKADGLTIKTQQWLGRRHTAESCNSPLSQVDLHRPA